jgi:N-acetyl-anhydromuramyl-L-alanine amidase AmpD
MARTTTEPPHIFKRVPGATHGSQHPVAVVIHATISLNRPGVADVLAIPNYWRLQGKGYNAHCVTDGEGHTAKCALDSQICWAVAGSNTGRLHIELVGSDTDSRATWLSDGRRQGVKEAAKWTAYWGHRWKIPMRRSVKHGVAGHVDYSNAYHVSDHTDPGPGFPWDQFLRWCAWYYENGWVV